MPENNENLLFIIPGFFYIEDYQKLLYYNDIPLGTLQISSFLRSKKNITTKIIDLRLEQEKYPGLGITVPDRDQFESSLLKCLENNKIQDFQNIGINCYTSFQYPQTDLIARILKKEFPKKTIIVGGYHPTAIPEDFLYPNTPFDYVIRGEGELALLKLFSSENFKKKREPRLINSEGCIEINSMPFPDYELYLQQYPYQNKFKFEFFMSRGCPYQCAFCAQNFEFRSFRFERFKEQFEKICHLVQNHNPNLLKITFADQSFNRVTISNKVLSYLIENHFQDTFNFSCQARVEPFAHKSNLIKKYRKAKMVVGFGFESASKNLLIEMHKNNNPNKYIRTMKKILKQYKDLDDVYCRLNILVGFPGEDKQSFNETLDFLHKYALHKNIQISPTLFSNYPNGFVYRHMDYYENKFGAQFIKEWWKSTPNPFKSSVPEKTSRFYTKKELIGDYKDKYFDILRFWNKEVFADLVYWKSFFNKWYKEL